MHDTGRYTGRGGVRPRIDLTLALGAALAFGGCVLGGCVLGGCVGEPEAPIEVGIAPEPPEAFEEGSEAPSSEATLAVGAGHSCAVAAGALYCWGDNSAGQLGLGRASRPVLEPTLVPLAGRVVAVSATGRGTCAFLEGGARRCFGEGGPALPAPRCAVSAGRLDCPPAEEERDGVRSISAAVERDQRAGEALREVRELASGLSHACARVGEGEVRCWGDNRYGAVGDSLASQRADAVLVLHADGRRPSEGERVASLPAPPPGRAARSTTFDFESLPAAEALAEAPAHLTLRSMMIRRVAAHREALAACAEGEAVIEIEIDPRGGLSRVELEGGSESAEECARRALAHVLLPTDGGRVIARFPLGAPAS